MNGDYHVSSTFMPDGSVFAGEHEGYSYPSGNQQQLIASVKKNTKGLVAKTIPSNVLGALSAKISQGLFPRHLSAATTIADAGNISHLQQIRLNPQLAGTPVDYFWLDGMFVTADVPQLEGRETFYDTTATAEYKDRMEESKSTKTKYDEIKYDLKKLVDKAFTPIEDIMRTIINPQTVDLGQISYGMKFKRNQSALAALKEIGNTQSALPKFSTLGAGDFHSTNKAADELDEVFGTFLTANDVKITDVAMNAKLLRAYSSNTWTLSGPTDLNPIRLAGGGEIPLPGIQGVTCHVDPTIPDDTIYAVNKPSALRLGEGAKITRRYYDEERDSEALKFLDFHQYLAVNTQITKLTRKFGMTIPVTP